MRIFDGYCNNRDALVKFGREVRRVAAAEHLRYEILPARDEGLLLYLRRPRFFREPPTGCDALVVPLDEEPWRSGRFSYRVTVEKKGDEPMNLARRVQQLGKPASSLPRRDAGEQHAGRLRSAS